MKILAAVDGSFQSEAAMSALAGFKWAGGTEIILFTVLKGAEFGLPFGRKNTQTAPTAENLAQTGESLKVMAATLESNLSGCRVRYLIAQGDPKNEILDAARDNAVDIILMGSRGHKGMDLILLGSVSQAVLMQAQCPVIIVKSDQAVEPNLHLGFKNVLITVDNSPYSKAALNWAKNLKWPADTRFKLLTVVQPLTDSFASEESAVRANALTRQHDSLYAMARTTVEDMAQELIGEFGVGKVTTQVSEGDPREAILHVGGAWGADLIVMGSHGRTGLTKLFLGSVSHAVAVQGYCSVAIVKGIVPRGQGGQQQTGMFKIPDQVPERNRDSDEEPRVPPVPYDRPDNGPHVPPGGMF
jgi:nucleotide-binding universal stress UspA family protein